MTFPEIVQAAKLHSNKNRLFIGAYGFEERSLGWANYQANQGAIFKGALTIRYKHPKGRNRISQLRKILGHLGVTAPTDIPYDVRSPHHTEEIVEDMFKDHLGDTEEIVIDISSMTKFLILVCLCKLSNFRGTVRIVYSEAENYAPTQKQYEKSKEKMGMSTTFPSRGFESIIRTKCLSSIRMQGQPVSVVAFTSSFNEQLVSHMLGTINPHRLIFINGRPPRADYAWREKATQEIHKRLINEYQIDNPTDKKTGALIRVASTLYYGETIDRIEEIYNKIGAREKIICIATGSKMQTVGLFFSKIIHPDIHIEYPTPDSYFVKGRRGGVRGIYEIVIPKFSEFLGSI